MTHLETQNLRVGHFWNNFVNDLNFLLKNIPISGRIFANPEDGRSNLTLMCLLRRAGEGGDYPHPSSGGV